MRFNPNESLGNALPGITVPAVTIEQAQQINPLIDSDGGLEWVGKVVNQK